MEAVIYLDTHVVAWLFAGETAKLSQTAVQLIRNHPLLISPMVSLELQYLYEIRRTRAPAQEVVSELSQELGLEVCERPFPAIIFKAQSVTWTRDPFDRIIVGQAALRNDSLVTKDDTIRAHYGQARW